MLNSDIRPPMAPGLQGIGGFSITDDGRDGPGTSRSLRANFLSSKFWPFRINCTCLGASWAPRGNLTGASWAPPRNLNIGIRIAGKRNLESLAQILLRNLLSLKYDFSCQRYEFLYWGCLGGAREAPVRCPQGAHEAPKHVQLIRKGLNLELKKICS